MFPQRDWGKLTAIPVVLLGYLVLNFALVPAHGMGVHSSVMPQPNSAAGGHAHSTHQAAEPGAKHAGETVKHQDGDTGHGNGKGMPTCHDAPNFACPAPKRSLGDPLADLSFWLALATVTLLAGLISLFPRSATGHYWWTSKPPWRPTGTSLLSLTCVSRT